MDLDLFGSSFPLKRAADGASNLSAKKTPENEILRDIDRQNLKTFTPDKYSNISPTKVEVIHELPKTAEYKRKSFKHTIIFPPGMKPPPNTDNVYKCQFPTEPCHEFPFKLDPFQKCSIGIVNRDESVMVCAHTSAGKTAVAEYAIAQALSRNQRVIYTSPIKALSNQKFRDLSGTFKSVGLQTGDVTVHPDADCVIMTTEVLREMLVGGSEMTREVGWVIFDEVHYMKDAERGVVWEETIIHLPANVKYVLLSATLPNAADLTAWIGVLKHQVMHVIYTEYRPVPLDHYLVPIGARGMFLVKQDDTFISENFAQAVNSIKKLAAGGSENSPEDNSNRGSRTNDKGSRNLAFNRGYVQTLDNSIKVCIERNILPVIVFTFNRVNTEKYAKRHKNANLLSAVEREKAKLLIDAVFSTLPKDVIGPNSRMEGCRELYYNGVGYHHSGLLPVHKELVETLLQSGFIKILFATDTFAMGVNVPVRSVIISETDKFTGRQVSARQSGFFVSKSETEGATTPPVSKGGEDNMGNTNNEKDGEDIGDKQPVVKEVKEEVRVKRRKSKNAAMQSSVRPLLPSEYSQMAGRSGRRGMDTKGTVIIIMKVSTDSGDSDENDRIEAVRKMLVTAGDDITSRYKLTFTGILRNERSGWDVGASASTSDELIHPGSENLSSIGSTFTHKDTDGHGNSLRCLRLSFLQYQADLRRQEFVRQIQRKTLLLEQLRMSATRTANQTEECEVEKPKGEIMVFRSDNECDDVVRLLQSASILVGLLSNQTIRFNQFLNGTVLKTPSSDTSGTGNELIKKYATVGRCVKIALDKKLDNNGIRRQFLENSIRSRYNNDFKGKGGKGNTSLSHLQWGVVVRSSHVVGVIKRDGPMPTKGKPRYENETFIDVIFRIPYTKRGSSSGSSLSSQSISYLSQYNGKTEKTMLLGEFLGYYKETVSSSSLDINDTSNTSTFSIVVTMPIAEVSCISLIKLVGIDGSSSGGNGPAGKSERSYKEFLMGLDRGVTMDTMAKALTTSIKNRAEEMEKIEEGFDLRTPKYRDIFTSAEIRSGIEYEDGVKIISKKDAVGSDNVDDKLKKSVAEAFNHTLQDVVFVRTQLRRGIVNIPKLLRVYMIEFTKSNKLAPNEPACHCVFDEERFLQDAVNVFAATKEITDSAIEQLSEGKDISVNHRSLTNNIMLRSAIEQKILDNIRKKSAMLEAFSNTVLSKDLSAMLSALIHLDYLKPIDDRKGSFAINTLKCAVCCNLNVVSPLDLLLTEVVLSGLKVKPVSTPLDETETAEQPEASDSAVVTDGENIIGLEEFCAVMTIFIEGKLKESEDTSTGVNITRALPGGVLKALQRVVEIVSPSARELIASLSGASMGDKYESDSNSNLDTLLGELGGLGLIGRTGMCVAAFLWAHGKDFNTVVTAATTFLNRVTGTKVCYEGDIARSLRRLVGLLEDVRDSAELIGNTSFVEVCNAAIKLLRRGIVVAPSLYVVETNEGDEDESDPKIEVLKRSLSTKTREKHDM